MAKKMKKMRPVLRAAIAARDLAKLEKALEESSDISFEMKVRLRLCAARVLGTLALTPRAVDFFYRYDCP